MLLNQTHMINAIMPSQRTPTHSQGAVQEKLNFYRIYKSPHPQYLVLYGALVLQDSYPLFVCSNFHGASFNFNEHPVGGSTATPIE